MGKEIVTQVQEAQRVPGRINPRRNTQGHTVIKLANLKHREDKINKGKNNHQRGKGTPTRPPPDFSAETASQQVMA